MNLKDVLVLNNDIENLNIINEHFNQALNVSDYEELLLKYLEISNYNHTYELSLKEGSRLLSKILEEINGLKRESIYYHLFIASLNLERFSDARKYLNLRKEILPEMKQYLSLLDQYELDLKEGKDVSFILEELLKETLPLELKKDIKDKLYKAYSNNLNYLKALELVKNLYEETYDNFYKNEAIKILYLLGDYQKVIDDGLILIEESLSNLETISYVISALIKNNHLNYAVKLETEYEYSFINSKDKNLKKFYYNELLKLYHNLNNNLSIELYKERLNELKEVEEKNDNKQIIKEEVIKIKEIKTEKFIRSAKYLEHFNWVRDFLIYSKNIDETLVFREYLRTLFIYIEEKQSFNEVVIYYNKNNYDSNLFNYKNKRLYDKRIINESLSNTLINESLKQKKDFFLSTNNLITNKDILTQKQLSSEIKFIYSFYLDSNFVVNFYLAEEVLDIALYYELLSGIVTILKLKILDNNSKERLLLESRTLSQILNNKVMPIRVHRQSRSTYNDLALSLFNLDANIHIEMFLRELELEDANNLKNALERLFSYPNETKVLVYKYHDKTLKESLFAYNLNDEVVIVSFFLDITDEIKSNNELKIEAKIDIETSLFNKAKFISDFNDFILEKRTFILIELNSNLSLVYGTLKANQFFIELAKATNKHFLKNVYRYNFNQLLVVLDINDVRSVNNLVSEYLLVISHLKSKIILNEKFDVKVSSLRYPVATSDKNIDKILKYLDVALQNAKYLKKDYIDFTYNMYEQIIYEQEIIDYLNNAIDKKEMNLQFRQIININENIVSNYESELYLESINISPDYLYNLAKKRNKLVEFEYFHLEYVLSFLKKLEAETNYLIKITVPISEITFLNIDFEDYVIGLLKKYEISAKFLNILVNANLDSPKKLIKAGRLIKYGIDLESSYLDNIINEDFKALHLKMGVLSKKWRIYYENINLILNHLNTNLVIRNVSKKEDRELLKKLKINYIEGPIYSKISSNDLINQIRMKKND